MTEVNDNHMFYGIHVLGEMFGISPEFLDDQELLENALKQGIEDSGATLCSIQSKQFDPHGITILALLSESHASIHTYPELGALFFDAFTCGNVCKPQKIADALIKALSPSRQSLTNLQRGNSL